jgi:hypothetical protein
MISLVLVWIVGAIVGWFARDALDALFFRRRS